MIMIGLKTGLDLTVFIFICFLFTNYARGITLSDSACYGTNPDCDFYSLQCNGSDVIRLENLNVGFKSGRPECMLATHCNSSATCCNPDAINDVTESFNLKNTFDAYNNCSGKHECVNVQSPWQLIGANMTSTYVNLEYTCVQEIDILNFCGSREDDSAETKTDNSVQIQFDSRKQNLSMTTQMDCKCTINADDSNSNISMTLIDLRLHSYETIGNTSQQYNCSTSNITSQVYNRNCVNSTNHYQDNFQYGDTVVWETATAEVFLYGIYSMGVQDSPAMVWLQVEADNGGAVSVSCNQVFPTTTTTTTTFFTTTSTSSTTSTTSSTSTTSTMTSTSDAEATTFAGQFAGNEDDDDDDFDNVRLYLAIFIPVGFILVVPFLCIVIWKYRQKKKGGKQLKYLKNGNGLRNFRDSQILDRFIYDITKMDLTADSPAVFDAEKEVKQSPAYQSQLNQSQLSQSRINPVFIPDNTETPITTISGTIQPPKYSTNNLSAMMKTSQFSNDNRNSQTSANESVVNNNVTELGLRQSARNSNSGKHDNSVVQQSGTGVTIYINNERDTNRKQESEYVKPQTTSSKQQNHVIKELADGGVVIRIGPETNRPNTNSISKNSAAIIVPETNDERRSATAHVLPGQSKGEENSVLFVNKQARHT